MEEHARRGLGPAVLIPAYNPGASLPALAEKLSGRFSRIVIVDDGSTAGRDAIAEASRYAEKVLVHPVNRGKGAAIKTGLSYLGSCDVVTADADGQHTFEDIARVADALSGHRGGLVLGVRAFSGKVPLRSRFGNWWTRRFFRLLTGIDVADTQTGLRGIPAPLVERVASLPGERYEYEMVMLADARNHREPPLQVPIATVYIDGNSASHFSPLADTFRIYGALFRFLRRS